jgi:hypothetical protein
MYFDLTKNNGTVVFQMQTALACYATQPAPEKFFPALPAFLNRIL